MITYKLTNNEKVMRMNSNDNTIWLVPTNSRATWMANEYQDWLAEGNEPEPADEPAQQLEE